ncbi:hypothetical protein QWZ03_17610 [Chitinimonas viridis]|uniref:DUF3325 domain-containing protein n=1 Tax=Chitinimonas viridis TaxID=664880 RepID=A0ABT8B8L4_9NEIS|nr:hypothetical protein [Chitinimonas viridis]MDN3578587.1 hypothetical protein [Chitinimonas viridis]
MSPYLLMSLHVVTLLGLLMASGMFVLPLHDELDDDADRWRVLKLGRMGVWTAGLAWLGSVVGAWASWPGLNELGRWLLMAGLPLELLWLGLCSHVIWREIQTIKATK